MSLKKKKKDWLGSLPTSYAIINMPPPKPVLTLLDQTLGALRGVVTRQALQVAKDSVTKFTYDEFEADEDTITKVAWEREIFVSEQVDLLKEHLVRSGQK